MVRITTFAIDDRVRLLLTCMNTVGGSVQTNARQRDGDQAENNRTVLLEDRQMLQRWERYPLYPSHVPTHHVFFTQDMK